MIKTEFTVTGFLVFLFFNIFLSCNSSHDPIEVKQFSYPSGSGIEFYNEHFYLIGDDATSLLQLDNNFNITDSILLYDSIQGRIPKETKPDLEGITVINDKDNPGLLIIGSGSLKPYRNTAWLIDLSKKGKTEFHVDSFYQRLNTKGLEVINIEGICAIPGNIVFSNRGNKVYQKNFLILTSADFITNQSTSAIHSIQINGSEDTAGFKGVSGLAYAPGSDKLILTVSTEDTRNAYEDGTIGKSYLWIIDNISSKIKNDTISANRIIDLETIDSRFTGEKVESACVISENEKNIFLALTADNDKGSSTVFKINILK